MYVTSLRKRIKENACNALNAYYGVLAPGGNPCTPRLNTINTVCTNSSRFYCFVFCYVYNIFRKGSGVLTS